ncbi:hypothetical protein PsorP6_016447 [Peronosclerospora sorghi]|uniref:Uncharacterized protein n=1 Tax=Peronosclerospora sorghi TaxID=230839 RepID=A0ACC0VKG4_9STRA|nr:hypothetical protein PsorP6_016447 [Peronosclerospora sorghi]
MRIYIPISFALLASTGLAKVLSAVETEVVHNHLRAVQKHGKEKEDRMLSSEAELASFVEAIVSTLPGFPAADVKKIVEPYVAQIRKVTANSDSIRGEKDVDNAVFHSLFLHKINAIPFSTSIDGHITAYLTYLKLVGGEHPITEAAKRIDSMMTNGQKKTFATIIEDGQFLIWSQVDETRDGAIKKLFGNLAESTSDDAWKQSVLDRYETFYDNYINAEDYSVTFTFLYLHFLFDIEAALAAMSLSPRSSKGRVAGQAARKSCAHSLE